MTDKPSENVERWSTRMVERAFNDPVPFLLVWVEYAHYHDYV